MNLQLSSELNDILTYAKEEAMRLGNYTVSTDHLILGILRHRENITVETLASLGVNVAELKVHLENAVMAKEPIPIEKENMLSLSKASENALKIMFLEARSLRTMKPDSSHLFLAILRAQDGNAVQYLENAGITYEKVRETVASNEGDSHLPDDSSQSKGDTGDAAQENGESEGLPHNSSSEGDQDDVMENGKGDGHRDEKKGTATIRIDVKKGGAGKTPVLDSFGYDLTKAAMEDKLDPVVGREKEIERLAQILGRRKKNNPVLIGEPGVGKSAIAEGLAIRIAKKNVSRVLLDKRVVSLDIGSIVAGTKYRGQFEERMKAILNELAKNPNIILFIDEMHTLVGAGGAAGSLDAANMLKPALARGEIQCIGATTLDEFRQFIEKDGALERRFQKVIVEATGFEQTLDILQNIKERYQKHHNVVYQDEAILACISLSQRYITDRCLPDKAIDIMDEAGSRVHLKNIKVPKKILTLEKALEIIVAEKQDAVAASDFEKAAMYRDIEKIKRTELEGERVKWQQKQLAAPAQVTAEDVAQVVSMSTNIPVSKIAQSEGNKLATMGNSLKEKIIGQDAAVETVTRAIQRNRAGLKDPNKPIGTFLFLGPTGVGKTQLAKVLAQYMFDSPDSIIRIDMSEYMEKHAVSRLIGAPPGYVGYNEGGQLSERVRRKPYSVVLLDEIEKAHPDIFNLLLQVLDEGRLTDSNGRHIDFRNTVLILTSNIGTKELKDFGNGLGFSNVSKRDTVANSRMIIEKAIKKAFTPEFLNRLDEQILFNPLTKEDIERIIEIELKDLYERVAQAGFKLKLGKDVKKFVADAGFDPQYGARPLKRAIQRYIEDPLAEKIISGEIKPGETIKLKLNKEKDGVL
ncbi:MAG: ATP-dependent Clp protease ATP-binding subunit [Bacteroidales bacterium]|nr:ATP-dependent Clp protease ATP-binding subunit [Bacteroidales bacterium]